MNNIKMYEDFLKGKAIVSNETGFTVDVDDMHESLFGHQKVSVAWAAKRGRALVASKFGLGKTRTGIELLRHAHARTDRPVMVICPLGVKHQFMHIDGPAMGVQFAYVRDDAEAAAATTPYLITNYERVREGNITEATIDALGGVVMDEAAILGNLGTKTQQIFLNLFCDVPYRW